MTSSEVACSARFSDRSVCATGLGSVAAAKL